ncbi:MAG: response regulator [Methanobacterium sp.]|uniref:response regulator n=1 Tax=Methanobacterium sp. TaxID=2164 RepID=UPI003C755114
MNAKILVVEDERITAEDIKKSLEKAGYKVPAIVSTGEDAIKFSEKYKPDLVLMDIVLEGKIDGIEAAEIIRTKFDIPVIYLTAYSDKSTVERAKTTHPSAFILKEPFGFLHKPFEENELYTAIDILLNRNEEKTLKDYDNLIFSLLKSVSDGAIVIDSKERIKFMNSQAETLISYNKEVSIGKNFYEIFNNLGLQIDVSYKDNIDDKNGEVLITSKTNVKTMIEGTIIPINDKNGIDESKIIIFHKKNP